jgi:malonyl-CoA O-methyltransferase
VSVPGGDPAPDIAARYALDIARVRRAFDRAAPSFDAAAVLHAEVRRQLLDRLELMAITPRVVVDAGSGTGHGARALARRYPGALVAALDRSPRMLTLAARQSGWLRRFARICADAECLPLADAGVDLVVSNLMLQWCDLDRVLEEFRRVLKPGGLLSFTTLGPDTLHELRSAWRHADERTHVHRFIDMHDVGDALVRNGFEAPVLDVERYTLSYSDVRDAAMDLKSTGAHNATEGRTRTLTGRARFASMQSAYEAFRKDGRLPATYEVVFGHAWVPRSARGARDAAAISLADVKRELRARRRP